MSDNTKRMDDGFSTIITFAENPSIRLEEKEVTPPPIMAGGPIDTTNMRSETWRTKSPKQLKELGKMALTVAYATVAIEDVIAMIGIVQLITLTYPDGSTIEFYGWLDEFTPSAHKEGDQPTAACSIIPGLTNADGDRVAPAYTEPSEETT